MSESSRAPVPRRGRQSRLGDGEHRFFAAVAVLESAAVAAALTGIAKATAGRQRPYTLDLPDDEVGTDAD